MNVQDLVAKYKTSPTATSSAGATSAPKTVQDLVAKYKNYQAPPPTPDPTKTTLSQKFFGNAGGFAPVVSDIKSDIGTYADSINKTNSNNQNVPSKALQDVGSAASLGSSIATDVVKPAINDQTKDAIKNVIGKVGNTPVAQALGKAWDAFTKAHPEAAANLGATGSIASILPTPEAAEGAAVKAGEVGARATEIADAGSKAVKQTASDTVKNVLTPVRTKIAEGKVPFVKGLDEQVKTSAQRLKPIAESADASGKNGLSPQLAQSAERARDAAPFKPSVGAAVRKPLVEVYDDFAKQEAKHLADIKEDPAISMVGSKIGDAFKDVVKQKQAAGKAMGDALQKTANVAVDTKGAFSNFQKELLDNGATFDAVKKELTTGDSKFGSADKSILEKYASELQGLGNKPTMKQLDSFLGRLPQEIDSLKASKGLNFKTNAERLISKNMGDLRDALAKSGSPEYNSARKQFSTLAKFVDNNASFLGNITESGDFAKDASLAKSSVQSVLNNGKKDFLIKLEELTGYPALDESVLALQAMKDAGDAKGNSLLELLSQGAQGAAAGPHGITAKLLEGITGMGKKVIAGSPAEQTRAYLKALKK